MSQKLSHKNSKKIKQQTLSKKEFRVYECPQNVPLGVPKFARFLSAK
jgi:hypothetical protein